MSPMASQITSLTIVYSTVYSCLDQTKHQSSAALAFVRGILPGTGKFHAQMASNAENVSIWGRHHGIGHHITLLQYFSINAAVPVKQMLDYFWFDSVSRAYELQRFHITASYGVLDVLFTSISEYSAGSRDMGGVYKLKCDDWVDNICFLYVLNDS